MKQTLEQIELQVEETKQILSKKYNRKVYGYIVNVDDANDDEQYAVIYVKEPERMVKLRVLDLATTQGITTAGDTLLSSCILTEESDKRIQSNDALYITMIMNVMDLVQLYSDVIKKK